MLSSRKSKPPRRWNPSEDRRLAESVKAHGEVNWKAIAAKVGSRNHVQCLQRWKKVGVSSLFSRCFLWEGRGAGIGAIYFTSKQRLYGIADPHSFFAEFLPTPLFVVRCLLLVGEGYPVLLFNPGGA